MKIDYVENSTTIHSNGKVNGMNLNDTDLLNNGTLLEHDKLNVVIKDSLPDNLEYIIGSTMIAIKEFMHDYRYFTDEIVSEEGIDIGSYKPWEFCYIKFVVKMKPNTFLSKDFHWRIK